MKRFTLYFTAMLMMLGIVGISLTFAQGGMRGRGGQMMGQMRYDTKTVETVKGDVVAIDTLKFQRRGGMAQGMGRDIIYVNIKTDKDTLSVHLGPVSYLDKQEVKIGLGDNITVTGSRITFMNAPALIAAQIKKGDKTLDLRKSDGTPLWSRRAQ